MILLLRFYIPTLIVTRLDFHLNRQRQADPIRQTSSHITPFQWMPPGVAIALLILFVWTLSLAIAFTIGAQSIGPTGCGLLIVWFTFLYTGLFVTGHDAMHGSIAPANPQLNIFLGRLSLLLYGLIPYEKLHSAHAHHHQFPASHHDPDFHNGRDTHGVLWYFQFMRRYWTFRQWIGIIVIYNGLHRLLGVPESDLLTFWAIPSMLSSVQLFYFGTYLAHRQLPDTYSTPLRANSTYWPYLISLVSCYHFGYHREHHACPEVPWWRLPQSPQISMADDAIAQLKSAKYKKTITGGSTFATTTSPLVKGDRTRLKT